MQKTFCDRHDGLEGKRIGVLGGRYIDASGNYDNDYESADLCDDCVSYVKSHIETLPIGKKVEAFQQWLRTR